jgi:membrane protein YdbS with pleckstrin-like domain
MHSACPHCRLPFRREEGFWLGAMYCSYLLAVAILAPLFFLCQWLFPNWPGLLVAFVATLPYLPLTPLIFRYSRVLWIFFEDYVEPSGLASPRR